MTGYHYKETTVEILYNIVEYNGGVIVVVILFVFLYFYIRDV